MTQKVKWGILGLGKIAAKFASDLQLSDGSVLYGVASRSLEKANDFKAKYNAVKAFGTYEELAKDPNIDVVYIATPHALHYSNTMLCLENGKAVLCEKPLGLHAFEAQTMIAKAAEKNLFLMEGLWTRFIPATEKLIQLLAEKAIGDIVFVQADFGFKPPFDPHGRIYNKSLGGGSLLDIGIYPIYLSMLALGLPKSIQATARLNNTGIDTFCALLFDYPNGAKAVLQSTFEANTTTEATIFGSKGFIKMHAPFHHTQKLTLHRYSEPEQLFNLPLIGEGYLHEIEEVVACIQNGQTQSSKHPHSVSLHLSNVLEAVKQHIGLNYATF